MAQARRRVAESGPKLACGSIELKERHWPGLHWLTSESRFKLPKHRLSHCKTLESQLEWPLEES